MAGSVHQESNIFDMVVLVPANDVEHHAAELLFHFAHGKIQPPDDLKCLLITVGTGLVEIKVGHRAEGLHVKLVTSRQSVKTARHEVTETIFFEQTTLAHLDAGIGCHLVIGVLDRAVTLRILQFPVFIACNAIEFEEPVLETLPGINLT